MPLGLKVLCQYYATLIYGLEYLHFCISGETLRSQLFSLKVVLQLAQEMRDTGYPSVSVNKMFTTLPASSAPSLPDKALSAVPLCSSSQRPPGTEMLHFLLYVALIWQEDKCFHS